MPALFCFLAHPCFNCTRLNLAPAINATCKLHACPLLALGVTTPMLLPWLWPVLLVLLSLLIVPALLVRWLLSAPASPGVIDSEIFQEELDEQTRLDL